MRKVKAYLKLWMLGIGLLSGLCGSAVQAATPERSLSTVLELDAPREQVWRLWSTEEGLVSFFAPRAVLEPRVGGLLEIHFDPEAAPGLRGAEDLRIVALEAPHRILFTWSAPPEMPSVRAQRTLVQVRLEEQGATRTRLYFSHTGWGEGPEWDQAYDYFDQAWNHQVLPRLVYRLEHGPVDWTHPPRNLKPVADTLKSGGSSLGSAQE